MARIRSIKPEFWSDEKLSECSLSARLLFIGLWSFADDEGRLEFSPARLRMQVFPCGTVRPASLTEWIGELTERSLIRRYVVDGREYLDIPNFAKHQRINRPTPSKHPPFSVSAQCGLTESSVSTPSRKGTGREREGKGSKTQVPATALQAEFDALRALYPRRAGDQRWQDAAKAIRARLAEGHTWDEMRAGVERYAAFVRATGREGSEFVKQAGTFFGTGKAFLETWEPPPSVVNGHAPKASSVDADGIPTWATAEERAELLRLREQETARADH